MEFSRRDFLKSGVAVGAAGALGLAGCTPAAPEPTPDPTPAPAPEPQVITETKTVIPSTEPFGDALPESTEMAFVAEPIADADIKATVEVDVVILGCGVAGITAAASAAESGLKVAVLEKGETFPARGGDIGAFGDKFHAAIGDTGDDGEEIVRTLMELSGFRADGSLIRFWVDKNAEAIEWFCDTTMNGTDVNWHVAWAPTVKMANNTSWFSTALTSDGKWNVALQKLIDDATANGATFEFNTPGVQLAQDASGKVIGAIAKRAEGYVKYLAAKGVVLATGGYDFNKERVMKYCRPRDYAVGFWMNPTTTLTGDGHEMALAIGAHEDEYPHTIMIQGNFNLGFPRVNKAGKRFSAEFLASPLNYNAVMNQPGGFAWIILDSNGAEAVQKMIDYGAVRGDAAATFERFKGGAKTADTLEALAKEIGVPADELVATFERYNRFAENGVDEDFGNPACALTPVKTGPFYALEERVTALLTCSGLRVSTKSEVLGMDGLPISGLYAIGNASGGMWYGAYPHNVPGISHSRCIVFGYYLGRRLAGLID